MDNNNGSNVEKSLVAELNKTPEQVKAEATGQSSSTPPTNQDQPQNGGAVIPQPQTTVEQKVKMPDGRELTADQVLEEYNKLNKDYTVKSQELSQLKNSSNNPQSSGTPPNPQPQPGQGNGSLSPTDQALRTELQRLGVALVDNIPDPQKIIQSSVQAATSNVALNQMLDDLEEDFDGSTEKVGDRDVQKPKVDRQKVIDFIVANPNTDMSPMDVARFVHQDEFIKYEAAKLMPTTSALPTTEGNGAGNSGTPPENPKPAYRFDDGSAERAVREILNGQAQ